MTLLLLLLATLRHRDGVLQRKTGAADEDAFHFAERVSRRHEAQLGVAFRRRR
jgi:hypothetical protein